VIANALPLPGLGVVAARLLELITKIGVTDADQNRSRKPMRLCISHGGQGSG